MGRGSYNGGSFIVRAIGWCATNSAFGKNRPLVRLGQHSKKRSAALAAKKTAAKQAGQLRDALENLTKGGNKAIALRDYATFADYQRALLADPDLASRHGVGPASERRDQGKK